MKDQDEEFAEFIACHEEPYEVDDGSALIYPRATMGITIRSQLVAGKDPQYAGPAAGQRDYETRVRRGLRLMCERCLRGTHALCESEDCPCVCNDSDFKWARKPAARPIATTTQLPPELSKSAIAERVREHFSPTSNSGDHHARLP